MIIYLVIIIIIIIHFTSLHFTSLHFTSLHFTSLHYKSYLRKTDSSSQRIPEIFCKKDFSQACNLINFTPSNASDVVFIRWSFTFISSRWIPANLREIYRVKGITTNMTTTPANEATPSFPQRRTREPTIWKGPDQIVWRYLLDERISRLTCTL